MTHHPIQLAEPQLARAPDSYRAVDTAKPARRGLALIPKEDPDVVIVDVRLPDMSGLEVFDRIKGKGASLTLQQFNGAGRLVDEQLGYEIARYVFGRPAEFKRRAADDRQMQTAMGLLRQAQTPKELLGLAASSKTGSTARN